MSSAQITCRKDRKIIVQAHGQSLSHLSLINLTIKEQLTCSVNKSFLVERNKKRGILPLTRITSSFILGLFPFLLH